MTDAKTKLAELEAALERSNVAMSEARGDYMRHIEEIWSAAQRQSSAYLMVRGAIECAMMVEPSGTAELTEHTRPIWSAAFEIVANSGIHAANYALQSMQWLAVGLPNDEHYLIARQALCSVGAEETDDNIVAVAREWCRHIRPLMERCGFPDEPWPLTAESPDPLGFDLKFCEYLATIAAPDGPAAPLIKALERHAKERAADDQVKPGEKWGLWVDPDCSPAFGTYAVALAHVLWVEVVEPEIERLKASHPLVISGVQTRSGDTYCKLEKTAATFAWAAGGGWAGGLGQNLVPVGDDQYAQAPNALACYVPRSWTLLERRADVPQPHQATLPLAFMDGTDQPMPLISLLVGNAEHLLPPVAGKLAVLMMVEPNVTTQLSEVTALVRRDLKRIRPDHDLDTALALWALDGVHLVLPNNTLVRLFSQDKPIIRGMRDAVTTDKAGNSRINKSNLTLPDGQSVGWSYDTRFMRLMGQFRDTARRKLNGQFIVNFTGIMRLPVKEPQLVRHIVNASAMWNDARRPGKPKDPRRGQYEPERLPEYTPEQWALLTNTMSEKSIAYLQSGKGRREYASRDKKRVLKELEALASEDHGCMIRLNVKGTGRHRVLRIEPPEEIDEAWHKFRHLPRPEDQASPKGEDKVA